MRNLGKPSLCAVDFKFDCALDFLLLFRIFT